MNSKKTTSWTTNLSQNKSEEKTFTSRLSHMVDQASEFFAHRKGLLLILAIILVALNAVLQFFPAAGWLRESDLLLHLGIIVGFLGVMVAWAL